MKKLLLLIALAAICGTSAAQDLIVRKNAETIDGKVLRIGGSKIEYTKAGDSAGPVYTLSTDDVLLVKYSDGREESFKQAPSTPKRILAQYKDSYPHYQGDIAVAYALGVGLFSPDRIVVETVHGVRLSPYAFIGAGAGFNYFYNGLDNDYSGVGILAPYANAKGYLPVSQNTSLYLSFDLGASVGVLNAAGADLYTAVGPGVRFGSTRNRMSFDLGIKYQYMGPLTSGVMFRIGFGF